MNIFHVCIYVYASAGLSKLIVNLTNCKCWLYNFFQDLVIKRHLYIWYSYFGWRDYLYHHTSNQLCCTSKSRGMCVTVHMPKNHYCTNTQSSNGQTALDVVSYIGCAISLACLLLSLLTFLVFGWVISNVGVMQFYSITFILYCIGNPWIKVYSSTFISILLFRCH